MATKCENIINVIEDVAPKHLAESWDNVGLMVGKPEQEIKKALICLDVTRAVVDEAVNNSVDIIISHHPFIFRGLKSLAESDYTGYLIHKLIKNNISVYSAHTNFDIAPRGLNFHLACLLGLKNIRSLNSSEKEECDFGNIGDLPNEIDLNRFINIVKTSLELNNIRKIGDIDKKIKRIAVFCGSYDESLTDIIKHKADILVTGDIKYHAAVYLKENYMCAIDAGHFGTEKLFKKIVYDLLTNKFNDIKIMISNEECEPFEII